MMMGPTDYFEVQGADRQGQGHRRDGGDRANWDTMTDYVITLFPDRRNDRTWGLLLLGRGETRLLHACG